MRTPAPPVLKRSHRLHTLAIRETMSMTLFVLKFATRVEQFDVFVFYGQATVLSVGHSNQDFSGRKSAWFGLAGNCGIVDSEGAGFFETLQSEIPSS